MISDLANVPDDTEAYTVVIFTRKKIIFTILGLNLDILNLKFL